MTRKLNELSTLCFSLCSVLALGACATDAKPASDSVEWPSVDPIGQRLGVDRWSLSGSGSSYTWKALDRDGHVLMEVGSERTGLANNLSIRQPFVGEINLPANLAAATPATTKLEPRSQISDALFASASDAQGTLGDEALSAGELDWLNFELRPNAQGSLLGDPESSLVDPHSVALLSGSKSLLCEKLRFLPEAGAAIANAQLCSDGSSCVIPQVSSSGSSLLPAGFGIRSGGQSSAQQETTESCDVALGFDVNAILNAINDGLSCTNGALGLAIGGGLVAIGVVGQGSSAVVTVGTFGTSSVITLPAWAASLAISAVGVGVVGMTQSARAQCASAIANFATAAVATTTTSTPSSSTPRSSGVSTGASLRQEHCPASDAKEANRDCWLFFHYTHERRFNQFLIDGTIRANKDNKVYVTWLPYTPKEGMSALFIDNPDYKGKTDYVIAFRKKDPGIKFYPGTQWNELLHDGSLRSPRNIEIVYAGKNPFK